MPLPPLNGSAETLTDAHYRLRMVYWHAGTIPVILTGARQDDSA